MFCQKNISIEECLTLYYQNITMRRSNEIFKIPLQVCLGSSTKMRCNRDFLNHNAQIFSLIFQRATSGACIYLKVFIEWESKQSKTQDKCYDLDKQVFKQGEGSFNMEGNIWIQIERQCHHFLTSLTLHLNSLTFP